MKTMNEVFIVSVARSPIGSMGGVLAPLNGVELGTQAIKEAVKRASLTGEDVQEVFMGNVLSANLGQAPTKQAALAAGITTAAPCTTINKVCASGMKSVILGSQSIMLGDNDVVVSGGMESMTNAPYYIPNGRSGYRYGNAELLDAIVRDGLQDPYRKYMMGEAGELCAAKYNFSREEQDAYAIESYNRASEAYKNAWFSSELFSLEIAGKGGSTFVSEDEEFKKIKLDKVASLKPAFKKDGTITAVNASKINDGSAAMVLMSGAKVKALGLKPLAKILSYADAAQEPDWFTTTPAKAMPAAVKKAGLSMEQIDYFEINEAFSVVALANMREMGLSHERTNVFGGAVSLGHPIGVSGARIIITLLSVLTHKGGRYGCAGICNGGGGASALVIEKL
jgi:acetyl-CoA C-acetyltransferase